MEAKTLVTPQKQATHWCSFCGKSNVDARYVVAADEVCICDECVEICRDVIGWKRRKDEDET